jgi:hypothetical protein
MASLTKEMEQYIEHEVQLRMNDEKFQLVNQKFESIDFRFQSIENAIKHLEDKVDRKIDETFRHLDSKISWTLGLVVGSIFLPVILHLFKLI